MATEIARLAKRADLPPKSKESELADETAQIFADDGDVSRLLDDMARGFLKDPLNIGERLLFILSVCEQQAQTKVFGPQVIEDPREDYADEHEGGIPA
jgi:hypothetical protein